MSEVKTKGVRSLQRIREKKKFIILIENLRNFKIISLPLKEAENPPFEISKHLGIAEEFPEINVE